MSIFLSYDIKHLSNNPSLPKTGTIGTVVNTSKFSNPTEIYEKVLKHNLTVAYSSVYDPTARWGNDGKVPYSGRAINLNAIGFQTLFIDVDSEYLGPQYMAHYIRDNVDKFREYGVAMVQKSHSYGKSVSNDDRYSTDMLVDKYPNGIKEGYHIMLCFDRFVSVSELVNKIPPDAFELFSNSFSEKYIKYTLESPTQYIVDRSTAELHTAIYRMLFKYISMRISRDLGIVETILPYNESTSIPNGHSNFGCDTASVRAGQKMYGAMKGVDLLQDTYIAISPIIDEAIVWFVDGIRNMAKRAERKQKVSGASIKRNSIARPLTPGESFEIPTTDREVLHALLELVPPRRKGSNTHNDYLKLITSCKYLGLDKDKCSHLYTDIAEFDHVWNSSQRICDNPAQMAGMFKNAFRSLVPSLLPSISHRVDTYEKIIEIKERYIPADCLINLIEDGHKHICVQSPYASGKTTLIKNTKDYFEKKGYRFIFVSHLRSILNTSSWKLGFEYYENTLNLSNTNVCITPHSFSRIETQDYSKTVLVIDEHTQVFKTLSDIYYSSKRKEEFKNMKAFFTAFEQSDVVILLDADDKFGFVESHAQKFVKLVNSYEPEKMNLITFKWAASHHGAEDEDILYDERVRENARNRASETTHAYEKILSLLEAGKKVAIPCGTRQTADELDTLLKSRGYIGYNINRFSEDKINTLTEIASGNDQSYSYCIYTYTAWTGFDVSVGDHPLDIVVAIFGSSKSFNHDDRAQAMKRFRGIVNGYVYGSWGASFKISTYESFVNKFRKKETSLLKSSMFADVDEIIALRLNDNIHRNLLFFSWYSEATSGYCDYNIFSKKLGYNTIYSETNAWRTTLHNELKELGGYRTIDSNTLYMDSEVLSERTYSTYRRSDITATQNIAVEKTRNVIALGATTNQLLSDIWDEDAKIMLDKMRDQEVKTITIPSIPKKFKKIYKQLRAYAMIDDNHCINLLNKRKDIIAPQGYDFTSDRVGRIMKVGSVHDNLQKEIRYYRELWTIVNEYADKPFIEDKDDTLDILYKKCTDFKTKHSVVDLRDNRGDSRDSGFSISGDMRLNVTSESHIWEDGDFKAIAEKYIDNGLKKMSISTLLSKIGYELETKKKQKNKVKIKILTVKMKNEMTLAIASGALDIIKTSVVPNVESELGSSF